MIQLNATRKRFFMLTYLLNVILLILYNSFLNVNVLIETNFIQSMRTNLSQFNLTQSSSFYFAPNQTKSNLIKSSNSPSYFDASKENKCVYSVENKSSKKMSDSILKLKV